MPKTVLDKVQRSAVKLLLPLDSETLYKTCVEEVLSLSGANYGSLFLEKNEQLARVYSNVPAEYRLKPRKDGNTYQSFKEGKIRLLQKKTINKIHPEVKDKIEAIYILPLSYQNKRVGVITVNFLHQAPENEYLPYSLKLFGSLASLAIRNIELYESAQVALKNRELFMSAAAHELKTPLAAIHAYSQLIQRKTKGKNDETTRWINSILANSQRLKNLIVDLFNLSQMNLGIFSYNFSNLDVVSLLKTIVADSTVLSERDIVFATAIENSNGIVKGDSEKLTLVFTNIIGNAMKYSESDTQIMVTLQKRQENYVVSIRDEGMGIHQKDLPHVFERFYQGKQHKLGGMGLGMYLCKEIIIAHEGEISIKSKVKKGTTVEICLPSF